MDTAITQTTSNSARLSGSVVSLAGRFATMPRERAVELIEQQGGKYSKRVTRHTTLLVVGLNGWPLRRDGRVSGKLRKAQRIQELGGEIEILREDAFLERLGLGEVGDSVSRRYTLDHVAELTSTQPERIKAWLKAGILEPADTLHGVPRFDFRQITAIKRLQELTAAGITAARLRQSLRQLATWLPDARDWLTHVELLAEGRQLVTRDEDGALVQVDGQKLFDFVAGADDSITEAVALRFQAPLPDADDLFHQALEAEQEGNHQEAADAYRQWLLAFGPDGQVCFNLGNTLFALGRYEAAAERFRQAIEIDPDYAESWSNLGCALAEIDETDQAIAALSRAVELRPNYADAIYNLADILQRAGRDREARRHWRAYLELDQTSPWAEFAREQLAR